ncbi:MAG: hemerythrin domain-containing protein [Propionibacterium sp.]|nr:hemerythrin domain-containing protein [Propionibacterium sp.]
MTTTNHGEHTSLAAAFTHEHHEIDDAIEAYLASDEPEPRRRATPLLGALEALRRHIYLEEEIVFPHLPEGPLMMAMMVMHREHGELWRRMDALVGQLQDPAASGDDVDDDERARVLALLEGGTLPPGWVCRDA